MYSGNSESWKTRNKTCASGKENSDFAASEAGFLRIFGWLQYYTTARVVCFLDLFVHLHHDRSNRKRPMCYFQEFDLHLVKHQWILDRHYWRNSISGKLQKLAGSLLSEENSWGNFPGEQTVCLSKDKSEWFLIFLSSCRIYGRRISHLRRIYFMSMSQWR